MLQKQPHTNLTRLCIDAFYTIDLICFSILKQVEKNELREEKLLLKADKERIEQQMNAMTVSPAGFVPTHPPVYQTGANKIAMFPGYSFVPLWQYHPPSTNDTYQDQKDIGRAA